MDLKLKATLLTGLTAALATSCDHGGTRSAIRAAHASRMTASTTPALPSPVNAAVCAVMAHCTASGTTFRFPDGTGGTVTCSNGACANDTSYNAGYEAGYSDGLRDGEDASASAEPENQREPASP